MIMDWCEMSSCPTIHGLQGQDQRGWDGFMGAYSRGKKVVIESLVHRTGKRLGLDQDQARKRLELVLVAMGL